MSIQIEKAAQTSTDIVISIDIEWTKILLGASNTAAEMDVCGIALRNKNIEPETILQEAWVIFTWASGAKISKYSFIMKNITSYGFHEVLTAAYVCEW